MFIARVQLSLKYPANIWMKNKNLFYLGVIVLMSGFSNLFQLHNFSYFF